MIPCQLDQGKESHATDPGKPKAEDSHFIVAKNLDSMPTANQVSKAGKASHVRMILGNQRAAISSWQRIVIPCRLRIQSARQANRARSWETRGQAFHRGEES
jgi:hypothetical protein